MTNRRRIVHINEKTVTTRYRVGAGLAPALEADGPDRKELRPYSLETRLAPALESALSVWNVEINAH
jgi:hypothetical protein